MQLPIAEFDPGREVYIDPTKILSPADVPERCVACFFPEVLEKVGKEHCARIVASHPWEDGDHPIYEITHKGKRLAYFRAGIGSPQSAAMLEESIAFGCRKFVACGGCGVLDRSIGVGHVVVVGSAVRDEGTSYHYLPPSREVAANESALTNLCSTLRRQGIPFVVGKTWSTDAPYRETKGMVAARRAEGCIVVEMEAAAMMAVAQHRKVSFAQLLYGGDDLSGPEWDSRDWKSRHQVRENLFWLSADAVLDL